MWYSNDEDIPQDLESAFQSIHLLKWEHFPRDAFVHYLAQCFPRLWQIHPFREGNTRTVVMMLTFFAEQHGYYMDQELMAESAGYVRDAFVMASLEQYAEREHLERILLDAVCDEPILYDEDSLKSIESAQRRRERYQKYKNEDYVPQPHYKREN